MIIPTPRRCIDLSIFACLACSSIGEVASADAASSVRREILADYQDMDRAAQQKNLPNALTFYAPDFVSVSRDGQKKSDRSAQVRVTEFFFSRAKSLRGTTAIVTFHLAGSRAVAVVKRHQEFVPAVPDAGLRKAYTVVFDTTSEDRWERRGQAWQMTRRQDISNRIERGGKPVVPRRPAASRPS